jgi:glycosyltransferase involved in cell wall biosynthesis
LHVAGPLLRLRRALVRERPDVLYPFLPTQAVIAAAVLPPLLSTKLVFGLRATPMRLDRYDRLSGLAHRLQVLLAWRADLLIANAAAIRDAAPALGLPLSRVAVVANGIDTEAFRPDATAGRAWRAARGLREKDFVVGLAARLDPMKDHATFLAAAAAFARNHADGRFVCIGPGVDGGALAARARALGLDGRVVLAGECADMNAAVNAFDVAASASSFGEASSNAIGEAMACGVPVAATDVGDARTLIGECGEVVPSGDPQALAAAWTRLRRRLEADRPVLAAAARARIVETAGAEAMVTRTETLLADLVHGRPRSPSS